MAVVDLVVADIEVSPVIDGEGVSVGVGTGVASGVAVGEDVGVEMIGCSSVVANTTAASLSPSPLVATNANS